MSDQPSEEIYSYQLPAIGDLFPVDNAESISSISTNPFEISTVLASPVDRSQRVLPHFADAVFGENTTLPYLGLAENTKYAYQDECTHPWIVSLLGDNMFDSSNGSSAFLFEADSARGFCDYYNRVKNPSTSSMSVNTRSYLQYPEETGAEIDYPVQRPMYRRRRISQSLYNSYPGVATSSSQPFVGDDRECACFSDRLDRVPAVYKPRDPSEFFPGLPSLSSLDSVPSGPAYGPPRRSARSGNATSRMLVRTASEMQYEGMNPMDRMNRMDRMDPMDRIDRMDRMNVVDSMNPMDRIDRMDRMDRMNMADRMNLMDRAGSPPPLLNRTGSRHGVPLEKRRFLDSTGSIASTSSVGSIGPMDRMGPVDRMDRMGPMGPVDRMGPMGQLGPANSVNSMTSNSMSQMSQLPPMAPMSQVPPTTPMAGSPLSNSRNSRSSKSPLQRRSSAHRSDPPLPPGENNPHAIPGGNLCFEYMNQGR